MPDVSALLLVDLVIAVTLCEGVALCAWHLRTGRGPAPAVLIPNLLAGLFLVIALRAVLAADPPAAARGLACAPWLVAAGLAHAADLWRRWPRRGAAPTPQ